MANVIKKATNRFTKGLVMDFSPENTKNEVLTHALNATLLTFNGNEMSLQNDMGNARVETAYLPEGYMPVGTCEYGGIIYIVSYNPLEDKSLIGCFPSPERNISSKELGIPNVQITKDNFLEIENGLPTGNIKHNTSYVLLKNNHLNPGDKFMICANKEIYDERLENLLVKKDPSRGNSKNDDFEFIANPILALNVVSIEDSGKITYLNSDLRRYDVPHSVSLKDGDSETTYTDIYNYHILGKMAGNAEQGFEQASVDLDEYRNVMNSGYSVFKSKVSGKLAILAELIMIDSYSVTHELVPKYNSYGLAINGNFDIVIHTDIDPKINTDNYYLAPKLQYFYLDKSQGYLQTVNDAEVEARNLFAYSDNLKTYIVSLNFLDTPMSSIYETYGEESTNLNYTLKLCSEFNFPKQNTYHGRMLIYNGDKYDDPLEHIYTKFVLSKYHRINYSQIKDNIEYYTTVLRAKFYYFTESDEEYQLVTNDMQITDEYVYYVKTIHSTYTDAARNLDYKDYTLYKCLTSPIVATKYEIDNTSIEKFQKESIYTYTEATLTDIDEKKELWFRSDDGLQWTSHTGDLKPNVTYYTRTVEDSFISIGNLVDRDKITGTIYYYPATKYYEKATDLEKEKYYDFNTYPKKDKAPYGSPLTLYLKNDTTVYIPASLEQILNYKQWNLQLFYNSNYHYLNDVTKFDGKYLLFINVPVDSYVSQNKFIPSVEFNYINNKAKPEPTNLYTKDDPIYLYQVADFIPSNLTSDNLNYLKYGDLKLGNILLPEIVWKNGIDIPFKYDYTIVPCMNYGKLKHLAVSNTVDFGKLHAFNLSKFNVWKYRIDDGYLRLTFGTEIFDTYETHKVDALFLEFYDHRGFAGSIEITDKASYNGVFTKVIPLNSLQAISRKRIVGNEYNEDYVRNVNIIEGIDEQTKQYNGLFYCNGHRVAYDDWINGWYTIDNVENEGWDIKNKDTNDCGTLYSNILYGVKTYLRRTTESGYEFIQKNDFFVYTLPLYNDYYYKIDDFSTLTCPSLEMMLTYKIIDKSSKTPYSYMLGNDKLITKGYNKTDLEILDSYLAGVYGEASLNATKYYQYEGSSLLYLEVGLKLDYTDINLAYDPVVNDFFKCELWLVSDNDKDATFSVTSGIENKTNVSDILNYSSADLTLQPNINELGFSVYNNGTMLLSNKITIDKGKLGDLNFLRLEGTNPIQIKYKFIVGYAITVESIRATQIQATTICALCHKGQDGLYNYKDFGIYELQGLKYLSNAMFYSGGTKNKEVLGVCRLLTDSATTSNGHPINMTEQCQSYAVEEKTALSIKSPGKLNTGEPLKKMLANIGKLTFCQPHAHGMDDATGVNLLSYGTSKMKVSTDGGGRWCVESAGINAYDDCYGIIPTSDLFNNPIYNMSLNTKNSVLYHSEFLSTVDGRETVKSGYKGYDYSEDESNDGDRCPSVDLPLFKGFTAANIQDFNKKLIETMKNVYAYNPDYNSLSVNVGTVTLQNYNPSFNSNILSINSEFIWDKGKTLNNYIFFGMANYAQYLSDLSTYSKSAHENVIKVVDADNKPLPQLLFVPDYTYCGLPERYYMVSQLKYSTPVAQEIKSELEFNGSNVTVIKNSEGKNSFIQGIPNKRSLYGYSDTYEKLIELDVNNYIIESDGKLKLKDDSVQEEQSSSIDFSTKKGVIRSIYKPNTSTTVTINPTWSDGFLENIQIKLLLLMRSLQGKNSLFYPYISSDNEDFFVQSTTAINNLGTDNDKYNSQMSITPVLTVTSQNKYKYSILINSIELLCESRLLKQYLLQLYGLNANLDDLGDEIYKLTKNGAIPEALEWIDSSTMQHTVPVKDFWMNTERDDDNKTYIKSTHNGLQIDMGLQKAWESIIIPTSGYIELDTRHDEKPHLQETALYHIKINKINFTIKRVSSIETSPLSIIQTAPTLYYTNVGIDDITKNGRVLTDYNNARIKGTSITINDLAYEPNPEGHRLFMKNDLCTYEGKPRFRLFYRDLDKNKDTKQWHKDYEHYNTLYLHIGPSFTLDNLYT